MHSSLLFIAFAAFAAAKTDLSGCTSSEVVVYGGASYLWYVPGTGEICSFLDCGGGRAPPMTTVPGCPLYSGVATYSPSFLPGFGSEAAVASTTYVAATTTSSPSTAMITGSQTTSAVSSPTTLSEAISSSSPVLSDSVSSGSVSMESVASTGTSAVSKSTSSTSTGTTSTGSSPSGSGSSTSSAASSSNTSNAGGALSVNVLAHGFIGAAAAGFAFLL